MVNWSRATLTSARSDATPRPSSELIANALRTQDVIVSGIVAVTVAWPSALQDSYACDIVQHSYITFDYNTHTL